MVQDDQPTTAFDAVICELLGDVGKLRLDIRKLQDEVHTAEKEINIVIAGAAEKLARAVQGTARKAQECGEIAGTAAVQNTVRDQIKILVNDIALAVRNLRSAADEARGSLRQAVANISIWRQVGFSAGAGATSALLVCLLIWLFGANVTVEGCPATLSNDQCGIYSGGVTMQKLYPKLPKDIQDYLTAMGKSVQ